MSEILGRVSFYPRGEYNANVTYEKYDFVSFNNGSYVYIADTKTFGKPVTNTDFWQPLADPEEMNSAIEKANSAAKQASEKVNELENAADAADEAAENANNASENADASAAAAEQARLNIQSDLSKKAPAIYADASGDMVHITDGAAMPVKSLISHVEPKQEGSGDPSPDNVRPIIGWDSVSVTGAGKNLFPVRSLTFTGQKREYFASEMPPGTYTISAVVTSADTDQSTSRIVFMNSAGDVFGYVSFSRGARNSQTVTVNRAFNSIRFYAATTVSNSTGDEATWEDIMVQKSETATAFEPYNGVTLTAELPETVYGGYYNWTNGEQGKTKRLYQFTGEENITQSSSALSFYVTRKDNPIVRLTGAEYDQKRKNVECSHFIGKSYIEWVEGCVSLYYGTSGETIGFKTSAFPDVAAFTAFLREQYNAGTPVTVVFDLLPEYWELLTPGVPQQLETLKGVNNIWSDAGQTEVTYVADTKMYIDQKIAAIAAAIVNE